MAIKQESVTAVLLADGWHEARSFKVGALAFETDALFPSMGQYVDFGPAFTLMDPDGRQLSGPISSILAVRH